MNPNQHPLNRRDFVQRLAQLGILCSVGPVVLGQESAPNIPDPVLKFPGPWSFQLPAGSIILVNDQQLEDLQDPDREVDLSLTGQPQMTTLRKLCQQQQACGARKIIVAFDHFWAQYRAGQGTKPRQWMPDTDGYVQRIQRISQTLKQYNLGLELSLLSPLELGPGYAKKTGEHGRWVQYREGIRDPRTGRYEVQLWEHQRWTNNKGTIEVKRLNVRAYAFRENRVGGTPFYAVDPAGIVRLGSPAEVISWEGATAEAGSSFAARRLTVRGLGDTQAGPLDRVLVVVEYQTPEMDYFSPQALPFLKELVKRYHTAGIPLLGMYADEMHIQQDWVYSGHHDEGQFILRFLTPHLARVFAEQYGAEFKDFEKYLVYFAYGQHSFLSSLDARLAAQHVLGHTPEAIQRTFLLRRRYYELLSRTVVSLFAQAKQYAEQLYGHEMDARAHATWAQSPTIDYWDTGVVHHPSKQYEYTPNFLWANTVQQSAAACDDYFKWNDFLTGGGNDHTEGGWSDRNYYALALGCSTGILNRTPYAYAAHWGMPRQVGERRQALVDAYGASANHSFQAVQDSEHRDIEVLMLYPISLVACEERFGSWMAQYGYANYVTADQLLTRGQVNANGQIEMAGRRFTTLVALFEPLPPAGLIDFLDKFVRQGGRLIWSGPPPRLDLAGADILGRWQSLLGVRQWHWSHQGLPAPGEQVQFDGVLKGVPTQTILTSFLVDHVYPCEPAESAQVVARLGSRAVGVHWPRQGAGSTTYLGFRPRDDQAMSLGYEVRTWFETLQALGAYPPSRSNLPANDNPSVVSRTTPYLSCRFPNGTVTIAAHYRHHVESWPGGFHRNEKEDDAILTRNPLPSDRLGLKGFRVAGHEVNYQGRLLVAFRLSPQNTLVGFGGYDCAVITINGTEHRFADRPIGHVAWAPVMASRRVPKGAILEIWAWGDGQLTIPFSSDLKPGKLYQAGPRPGSIGQPVPAIISGNRLVFEAKPGRVNGHLFLLEG